MLIRVISPLTMMPVGANGDSEPALAPLPTMIAIRKSGMFDARRRRHRHRREQRRRRDVAGPDRGDCHREDEEHDRHDAAIAATEAHGVVREFVERAVGLREREQQRDADERQEQRRGKSGDHRVERHVADVDADYPRHRDGQHADVERGDAADENGYSQCDDRDDGEIHAVSSGQRVKEFGGMHRARHR